MKYLFMVFMLIFAFPGTVLADGLSTSMALKPASHENICMVNNKAFDKPQIPVVVDGKTYYGCCPMCKERLRKDKTLRVAKDPVSGKEIDKADAMIGVAPDGNVYYFESEETMKNYKQ